jgi:hypothetical protein
MPVPPEPERSGVIRVRAPAVLNDDVAVVPKYALPAESCVVLALPENCSKAVQAFDAVKSRPTVTAAVSLPEFATVNPPLAALAKVAT